MNWVSADNIRLMIVENTLPSSEIIKNFKAVMQLMRNKHGKKFYQITVDEFSWDDCLISLN